MLRRIARHRYRRRDDPGTVVRRLVRRRHRCRRNVERRRHRSSTKTVSIASSFCRSSVWSARTWTSSSSKPKRIFVSTSCRGPSSTSFPPIASAKVALDAHWQRLTGDIPANPRRSTSKAAKCACRSHRWASHGSRFDDLCAQAARRQRLSAHRPRLPYRDYRRYSAADTRPPRRRPALHQFGRCASTTDRICLIASAAAEPSCPLSERGRIGPLSSAPPPASPRCGLKPTSRAIPAGGHGGDRRNTIIMYQPLHFRMKLAACV